MFWVVSRDSVRKRVLGEHTMHHFVLPNVFLVLSQRTCPIHSFRPKTHVMDSFARFRFCESGCWGCIQCTTLCFQKCFLFFRNKHAQSTALGPKLMFMVVSRDSVVAKAGVGGAYNAPLCSSKSVSCSFPMNMPNPLL